MKQKQKQKQKLMVVALVIQLVVICAGGVYVNQLRSDVIGYKDYAGMVGRDNDRLSEMVMDFRPTKAALAACEAKENRRELDAMVKKAFK
ncbi:MAG: hypothetical protein ACRC42_01275 [Mycoplasma sp.]